MSVLAASKNMLPSPLVGEGGAHEVRDGRGECDVPPFRLATLGTFPHARAGGRKNSRTGNL
jgi:hypothetical protein